MARKRNWFVGYWSPQKPSLVWVAIVTITPWNKLLVKPNLLEWGQQWWCQPTFRCHPPTMLIRQHVNWKIGDRRTWVCSHKIWNFASFVIDAKTSHMTSWEVILSPPQVQQKKWIPIGSKSWPQMQCDKLRFKGWGKLDWMHNIVEKTSKVNQKRSTMTGATRTQLPK
jgi:hypothetical protein